MTALTDEELKHLSDSQKTLSEMMEALSGEMPYPSFFFFLSVKTGKWNAWINGSTRLKFSEGEGPTPDAALAAAMEKMK